MKITFIGAAHEVTGSCTMLQVGGRNYLVDCGMEQGRDVFENVELPVAASDIEAVFLTHAHIDHSGMLPKLYKDGFSGKIYATEATTSLCNIMLRDSAHIQMAEVEWKNRKAERSGLEKTEPLYDIDDAEGAMRLFRGCRYGEEYQVSEDIRIRFTDIGHLLGSACIELWLEESGTSKKIVFSGDVGNINQPLIRDPQTVANTDYLVIESTYGNRCHEKTGDTIEEFAEIIKRAFMRNGNVIIPSFAVGRTQELLYALREIKNRGLLSEFGTFPVYVDSPLAVESTQIFLQCDEECFDNETLSLLRQGINPIWFDGIELSVTSEESRQINEDRTPKIIISASGMCEAGRIRHHLKHNLWKPENIVLFVGYQSEQSLGRKLLDGATEVTLFGEEISVKAEICSLHGTSGHADKNGLISWLQSFETKPSTVFINHGDEDACESFKITLSNELGYNAVAPYSGTQYDLKSGRPLLQTDGKRITKRHGESTKAALLYGALVEAAKRLLVVAQSCKGIPNKEISMFTDQINRLTDKWKK